MARRHAAPIVHAVPHTWMIPDEVKVASGDTDFIPGFHVPELSGVQVVQVYAARHKINSGTSAGVKVQKNGSDLTGFTSISVTTTAGHTDPTNQDVADGDRLTLIVESVAGTPKNLEFTLILGYTLL